jgi:hypothetical protein
MHPRSALNRIACPYLVIMSIRVKQHVLLRPTSVPFVLANCRIKRRGTKACMHAVLTIICALVTCPQPAFQSSGEDGPSAPIRIAQADTNTFSAPRLMPAASATLNSADTVVRDMELRNDFVLKGYESFEHGWYVGPGINIMGNDPAFTNNPVWSIYYRNPRYAGKVAKTVLPWVVILDGVDHAASNTAVEIRNIRSYVKSRGNGEWVARGRPASTTGLYYGKPDTNLPDKGEVVVRRSSNASTIRVPQNKGYFWHGWSTAGRFAIEKGDIAAILITVQARLVVSDESRQDDIAKAQLGLQVGADYYFTLTDTYSEAYAPAVGVNRTKTVTRNWQAFNFMTFSDVGLQDPGGGISEAAFRADPPPFE